jgi:putative DNA primase/helicase
MKDDARPPGRTRYRPPGPPEPRDSGEEFDRLVAETKWLARRHDVVVSLAEAAAARDSVDATVTKTEQPKPIDEETPMPDADKVVPLPEPKSNRKKAEPAPDLADTPFSESNLALQFASRHRAELRFVGEWGRWLRWNGKCWRTDKTRLPFDLAHALCRNAADQCIHERAKKTIESAKTIAAVLTIACTDRRLAATTEQWDADPMLLNTPDGVIDLRTGTMRPHRPEDFMTKIAAVGPRGDCPMWKAFLNRIMKGDAELIAYLKRVCGYCLTGSTSEQAMFFGYGVGANGKGVFLQTIGGVMADYCKAAAIETFTESKTDRHPTELARLHNARLVTATETETGHHWAESRIKLLTGGDPVTAHFMRKDDFEYTPLFKLFFSGNHKPGLRSIGEAMRRRLNMIHFAVTIEKKDRDKHFADKLQPEWPGILQWMIEGCLAWQKGGLDPPLAVTKATDDYFTAQNSFAFWLEECCDRRDPNAWTSTTVLFASWKQWAEKAGVRYGDIKSFREAMAEAGFEWRRKKEGNGYQGLSIRQDPPARRWGDGPDDPDDPF